MTAAITLRLLQPELRQLAACAQMWERLMNTSVSSRTSARDRHRAATLAAFVVACIFSCRSNLFAAAGLPVRTELYTYEDPSSASSSGFGAAMDAEGDYLVIGMPNSTGRTGFTHGAFVYDATSRQLLRTFSKPNQTANNSQFGDAVAISGNLAVIGAPWEHVQTSSGTRFNSGAAYVYNLVTGQELSRLIPQTPYGNAFVGSSVAINGDIVAVGGWGSAYLFNATTGRQIAKLNPSQPSSQFGISIALNDDVVVVGANSDDSRGAFTGAAFVFDVRTFAELRKIVPSDALGSSATGGGDNFGISLALDGDRAIIGSPLHSRNNGQGGAAYVFDVRSGAQLAKLTPPLSSLRYPENFGYEVDIKGDAAVVGAIGDRRAGISAGAAFLYDWTDPESVVEMTPSDLGAFYSFSSGVAIGNGVVYAGAPGRPGTGGVYEFNLVPEPASFSAMLIAAAAMIPATIRRHRRCLRQQNCCVIKDVETA